MSIDGIYDLLGKIFLYLTIALVVFGAVLFFVISREKKTLSNKAKLITATCVYAYALIVSGLMLGFKFASLKESGDIYELLLWPLVATVIVCAIGGGLLLLSIARFKNMTKAIALVFGVLLIGCFIAIMICMTKYFENVADWYPNTNLVGLIVSAVCFMALIAIMYFVGNKTDGLTTKSIVYGAISIALSFALSYIKFFRMPQGGSITLASMLPLLIYSCMFGTRRGIIMALIYGTLQAVQDPWIIHPMQFLLDYPIAYGVIGMGGIFMEKGLFKNHKVVSFIIGGVVTVTLRYACHVFSGVFAFADYADLDSYASAWAYSLVYNSSVFIDMVVALIAGSTLFASKSFISQMEKSSEKKADEEVVINDEDDDIDRMIIASQEKDAEENKEG